MSRKNRLPDEEAAYGTFKLDKLRMVKVVKDNLTKISPTKDTDTRHKVLWDDSSGTKVDAQVNQSCDKFIHIYMYVLYLISIGSIAKDLCLTCRVASTSFFKTKV